MSGMQRLGKPLLILDLSWAGVRGQTGARLGGPQPRGRGVRSLDPGQGPRLQYTVLVHDLLYQFLFLPAQGIELVPEEMGGRRQHEALAGARLRF